MTHVIYAESLQSPLNIQPAYVSRVCVELLHLVETISEVSLAVGQRQTRYATLPVARSCGLALAN